MSTSATHPLAGRLQLNNLALAVADLPRAIDWYQRVLGFAVEERGHFEPVAADFAMLVGAGIRLELVASRRATLREVDRTPPPRHLQVLGWKALVLQCDDLAALGEHLPAAFLARVPRRVADDHQPARVHAAQGFAQAGLAVLGVVE